MEWKLGNAPAGVFAGAPLKPSLVEWKQLHPVPPERQDGGLETFLSGMETRGMARARRGAVGPLKPSLVEWKRSLRRNRNALGRALETFLSGMETEDRGGKPHHGGRLETFLSGMETKSRGRASTRCAPPLETFLSGMETGLPKACYRGRLRPLKPSLVEWKLARPTLSPGLYLP